MSPLDLKRRSASREKFIEMAFQKGVPRAESAKFFDEQQTIETLKYADLNEDTVIYDTGFLEDDKEKIQ